MMNADFRSCAVRVCMCAFLKNDLSDALLFFFSGLSQRVNCKSSRRVSPCLGVYLRVCVCSTFFFFLMS